MIENRDKEKTMELHEEKTMELAVIPSSYGIRAEDDKSRPTEYTRLNRMMGSGILGSLWPERPLPFLGIGGHTSQELINTYFTIQHKQRRLSMHDINQNFIDAVRQIQQLQTEWERHIASNLEVIDTAEDSSTASDEGERRSAASDESEGRSTASDEGDARSAAPGEGEERVIDQIEVKLALSTKEEVSPFDEIIEELGYIYHDISQSDFSYETNKDILGTRFAFIKEIIQRSHRFTADAMIDHTTLVQTILNAFLKRRLDLSMHEDKTFIKVESIKDLVLILIMNLDEIINNTDNLIIFKALAKLSLPDFFEPTCSEEYQPFLYSFYKSEFADVTEETRFSGLMAKELDEVKSQIVEFNERFSNLIKLRRMPDSEEFMTPENLARVDRLILLHEQVTGDLARLYARKYEVVNANDIRSKCADLMRSADEFKKDIEASKSSLEKMERYKNAQSAFARFLMKDVKDVDQSITNPHLSVCMGDLSLVEEPSKAAQDKVRQDERNFSDGRLVAVSNSLKAKEEECRLLEKKCKTIQGRLDVALVSKQDLEARVVELRSELVDERADKAERIRMYEEEKRRADGYEKTSTQFAGLLEKYASKLDGSQAELEDTKAKLQTANDQKSKLVEVVQKQRKALATKAPGAKAGATHGRSPLAEASLFASAASMAPDQARGSEPLSPGFGE